MAIKGTVAPEKAKEPPKKGKGRKRLIVLLIVLLVVGGAGGYVAFAGGPSKAEATNQPKEEPKPEPGATLVLDPLTLNLANGRYLRIGLTVQLAKTKEKETTAPDGSKALDQAILLLTNSPAESYQTPEQLQTLKEELTTRISAAYDGNVLEVLLTQFVIQ